MPIPALLLSALPYLAAGAAGAGAGALAAGGKGKAAQFLGGTQGQERQFQRFGPEDLSAFNQVRNMGLQGLQNNSNDFAPIEAKARQDFSQRTIPSIPNDLRLMVVNVQEHINDLLERLELA